MYTQQSKSSQRLSDRASPCKFNLVYVALLSAMMGMSFTVNADSINAYGFFVRNATAPETGFEFSIDNQNWGSAEDIFHKSDNIFLGNDQTSTIYVNNDDWTFNIYGIYNDADNFGFYNNNSLTTDTSIVNYGYRNFRSNASLYNKGTIKTGSENNANVTYGIYNHIGATIKTIENYGSIETCSSGINNYIAGIFNYIAKIDNIKLYGEFSVQAGQQISWDYGIFNTVNSTINTIENYGTFSAVSAGSSIAGIANTDSSSISTINNHGLFEVKPDTAGSSTYSIGIINKISSTIDTINNSGVFDITSKGTSAIFVMNVSGSQITTINNYGLVNLTGSTPSFILNDGADTQIENINNYGVMTSTPTMSAAAISNSNDSDIGTINNYGLIKSSSSSSVKGILNSGTSTTIGSINNNGVFDFHSDTTEDNYVILNESENNLTITNAGIISISANESNTYAIASKHALPSVTNKGIIQSSQKGIGSKDGGLVLSGSIENNGAIYAVSAIDNIPNSQGKITNNGLIVEENSSLSNLTNNGLLILDNNGTPQYHSGSGDPNIYNQPDANSSFTFDSNPIPTIFNGYDKTIVVNAQRGELDGAVVNAYKVAIQLESAQSLNLKNTVVNGGLGFDSEGFSAKGIAIQGNNQNNTLSLVGNSIVNGSIDLGQGDDNLTLDNTVIINGNLTGGDGIDNLTIVKSSDPTASDNFRVLNNISSFDQFNVTGDTTLFEQATVSGTSNIDVKDGAILYLRLKPDGTHALSQTSGTLKVTNGGKVFIVLNGANPKQILFNSLNLDDSIKGSEADNDNEQTIYTSSILYHLLRSAPEVNSFEVEVAQDLPLPYTIPEPEPEPDPDPEPGPEPEPRSDPDPYPQPDPDTDTNLNSNVPVYAQLNNIYHNLLCSGQLGSMFITDNEQLLGLTHYLYNIYTVSPYAYSARLSQRSASIFANQILYSTLSPTVGHWEMIAGYTHNYGGSSVSSAFGSEWEIDSDNRVYGAYVQAEYGLTEDTNFGLLLGDNSARSDIDSAGTTVSNVDGNLIYFGAYLKRFWGDLRLMAGLGYQYGDYSADRTAVGYSGITTTHTYNADYSDHTIHAFSQLKYRFNLSDSLFVEPSLGIDYKNIHQSSANEGKSLGIAVGSKSFNFWQLQLGLDLNKQFTTGATQHKFVGGLYFNTSLKGHDSNTLSAHFAGGSGAQDFNLLVSPNAKNEFGLRAMYKVDFINGFAINLSGQYGVMSSNDSPLGNHDQDNEWNLNLGLSYKF